MKSKKPAKSKTQDAPAKSPPRAPYNDRLSVKDVCDIIKECKSANLSSLSFRDLSLTFGHSPDDKADTVPDRTTTPSAKPAGVLTPEQQRVAARRQAAVAGIGGGQIVDEIESDLEQLKVTDPVKYEQMVNDGDIR